MYLRRGVCTFKCICMLWVACVCMRVCVLMCVCVFFLSVRCLSFMSFIHALFSATSVSVGTNEHNHNHVVLSVVFVCDVLCALVSAGLDVCICVYVCANACLLLPCLS